MSDSRNLLTEMAEGLFADLSGQDFESAWPKIEEAGFAGLLVAEDQGGFGGDWGDLFAVLRLVGQFALALPLGETIIAHKLLADAGLARPDGAITLTINGNRAPWGRNAGHILRAENDELALYAADAVSAEHGESPADEPRDKISFTGAALSSASCAADVYALAALMRVSQAAGALDAALAMSIEYSNDRVQFGRPLSKFQAVQQNLAAFAAEAAAVNVAGQAAAAVLDNGGDAALEIASAKIRTNHAIGVGTAIAHQAHAAIGFTMEYALHPLTRRLMGWRSEYGNDAYWSVRLGKQIAAHGGAGMWHELTARSDALIAG